MGREDKANQSESESESKNKSKNKSESKNSNRDKERKKERKKDTQPCQTHLRRPLALITVISGARLQKKYDSNYYPGVFLILNEKKIFIEGIGENKNR